MPLSLLRDLAFQGSLTKFIQDPPGALRESELVTGFHLQFDAALLRRLYEVVWRGIVPRNVSDLPDISDDLKSIRSMRRSWAEAAIVRFGTDSGRALEALLGWSDRCREMNYPDRAKPVTIIIDYGEKFSPGWLAELPRQHEGYPIRYRYSPTAYSQVGAGSGVLGADFGTLGGVLEDGATHRYFGVTCAHVGGSIGQYVTEADSNGNVVASMGPVVDSTIPPAAAGACNSRASPGAGIDAALIDLSAVASIQPTSSLTVAPIVDIDQDDPIAFVGCKSGPVAARVAAATIWKKVDVGGQMRCFGDLFSIGHRQPAYVLQALSKGGDSGSWILDDPAPQFSSTRWIGVLIGGDKQQNQSLGCYSEQVFDWARINRPSLQLPP